MPSSTPSDAPPAVSGDGAPGPDDSLSRATLAVEGMTCAACSGRVEKALPVVPGRTTSRVKMPGRSGS